MPGWNIESIHHVPSGKLLPVYLADEEAANYLILQQSRLLCLTFQRIKDKKCVNYFLPNSFFNHAPNEPPTVLSGLEGRGGCDVTTSITSPRSPAWAFASPAPLTVNCVPSATPAGTASRTTACCGM